MTKKLNLPDIDNYLDNEITPDRRIKQASSLRGRKNPEQSKFMKTDNPMAGKTSPNKGKKMPSITAKVKGKKKVEGHSANVSKARLGVPIPKLQGRKRPDQSERLKITNPGFDATRIAWTCPHCNKEGVGSSNYSRWHGDNCKAK